MRAPMGARGRVFIIYMNYTEHSNPTESKNRT